MPVNDYFSYEVRRGNVLMTFYSDGSGPDLYVLRDEQMKDYGINERMRHTPSLVSPHAKTLRYSRDGSGYGYSRFFTIDSDLGRLYGPQPWARGYLPILKLERAMAFAMGAPEDVLKFDWQRAGEALFVEATPDGRLKSKGNDYRVVSAARALIQMAFRGGFVAPPDAEASVWLMLGNDDAIQMLLDKKTTSRILVYDGSNDEKPLPEFEKLPSPMIMNAIGIVDNWMQSVADAFAPYALVPLSEVEEFVSKTRPRHPLRVVVQDKYGVNSRYWPKEG